MKNMAPTDSAPHAIPPLQVMAVDDEREALHACRLMLQMGGVDNVICCQDPREVMGILAQQSVGVILLDLLMPHLTGQDLLKMITQEYPDIPVAMLTSARELETAVSCMRDGAFDYLVKPIERSRLLSTVRRAMEISEWRRACSGLTERLLQGTLEHPEAFSAIVSRNSGMWAVFQCIEAVARTSKPVLITGETGVGKELVARALHALSGRPGPFIAVNVAGLDENLLSDTLFGHRRGAFTGADSMQAGMIENADEGTLFLDEIGDLSPGAQIKLLRLIQEHEYFPLGANSPEFSNARVVTATHQNLEAMQMDGRFRRDLFFRLKCHHVHIPPLRERPDDYPLLVQHFLEQAARTLGKEPPTPPHELFDLIAAYDFPGNVRELESMIFDAVSKHHAKILSLDTFRERIGRKIGPIDTADSATLETETPLASWKELPTLEEMAHLLVSEAIKRTRGNQTLASRLLGISQPALSKRLKSLPPQ